MVSAELKLPSAFHGIKMKPFSKNETIITILIFVILVGVSFPSFIVSLRRARDQTRRDDLGTIQKMADIYYSKNKEFPVNIEDLGENVPNDPDEDIGAMYYYEIGPDMFQLFVSQEGNDEPEYDERIVKRGLKCGNRICNSGRNYNCPVDKSIEECSKMILQ